MAGGCKANLTRTDEENYRRTKLSDSYGANAADCVCEWPKSF